MNGEGLVEAGARRDEVRPLGVEALERILEGGEAEEVVVLLLARELDVVDRAAVALLDLVLHLEVGAARAVPALVGAHVDVPVVVHPLEHLLYAGHVLGVARADEEVVRDVQARHERLEALRVAVGQLLGLEALRARRVGDRLSVLVRAGQEEHVVAALAVMAGHDVRRDRRVGVAQVGRRVDVVDRRRHVEGAHGLSTLEDRRPPSSVRRDTAVPHRGPLAPAPAPRREHGPGRQPGGDEGGRGPGDRRGRRASPGAAGNGRASGGQRAGALRAALTAAAAGPAGRRAGAGGRRASAGRPSRTALRSGGRRGAVRRPGRPGRSRCPRRTRSPRRTTRLRSPRCVALKRPQRTLTPAAQRGTPPA
jgi:hypothetical protein